MKVALVSAERIPSTLSLIQIACNKHVHLVNCLGLQNISGGWACDYAGSLQAID